jgi:serine/threonine protein phosphatase PrpC
MHTLRVRAAGKAVALSEDHKPLDDGERRRIEAAGGTVNDVGGVARVNSNLNLSRAIGDMKYKDNCELPVDKQVITAHPDVRIFELTKEDRYFLLACDGVWDVMSNQARSLLHARSHHATTKQVLASMCSTGSALRQAKRIITVCCLTGGTLTD